MKKPVIHIDKAAFGYDGTPVLSGVDLTVHSGETLAVLGPNGSGKTTLIKGLLKLNSHLQGTIELFGIPMAQLTSKTRIGYVPQKHTLSTSIRATVNEIVAVGRLPHRRWYQPATKNDRNIIAHSLARVGMSAYGNVDVATLSGGQQRRVLIARALAANPEVLIMDEPTAGVDVSSQKSLVKVLHTLKESGVTMVIVTHELPAFSSLIDHIIEISYGSKIFDGTPQEYRAFQTRHLRTIIADHPPTPQDHQ